MRAEMLRSHHLNDDWEPVLVIYFMTHLFKPKKISASTTFHHLTFFTSQFCPSFFHPLAKQFGNIFCEDYYSRFWL